MIEYRNCHQTYIKYLPTLLSNLEKTRCKICGLVDLFTRFLMSIRVKNFPYLLTDLSPRNESVSSVVPSCWKHLFNN